MKSLTSRAMIAAIALTASIISSAAMAQTKTIRIGYLKGYEALNLSRIQGTLEKAIAPLGYTVEWKGPFGAYAPAAEALKANAIDLTVGSSSAAGA